MQNMWCKMKIRHVGVVILVCGIALSVTGFSLAYYPDNILFTPPDPPIMRELDATELFLVSNRTLFGVFGISGIMSALVGTSLLLWPKH